jgi:pilus assembly protein Flp/PilA
MVVMASKTSIWTTTATAAGRFLADERGATAIEYAIIASGIGGTIAAIVFGLGGTVLTNLYSRIAGALS